MNKIKRHFPGFVDATEEERQAEYPFSSLEELRNIEWVRRFLAIKGFKCFSISKRTLTPEVEKCYEIINVKHRPLLMAEYEDGAFWGIGYLESGEGLEELPDWVLPKKG